MSKKRILILIASSTALTIIFGILVFANVFGWFKKAKILVQNPNSNSEITASESNFQNTSNTNSTIRIPLVSGVTLKSSSAITKINQEGKLPKFKSYTEMVALLKSMSVLYEGNNYSTGGAQSQMAATDSTKANAVATEGQATSESADYSSTNTQVSGVDEGDIIKNDGKYIYIVNGNKVSIVEANSQLKNIGNIVLGNNEYISEIYLKGNILTIIGSKSNQIVGVPGTTTQIEPAIGTPAMGKTTQDMRYSGYQTTIVKVYDVSKKETPVLSRELTMDGSVLSTREKDGKFYIVTNKYMQYYPITQVKPEQILPIYSDSVKSKENITIQAENIEYCPENISQNFLLISVFDINNNNPVTIETILGAGSNLYMSNISLYIVQPYYRQPKSVVQPSVSTTITAGGTGTVVQGSTVTAPSIKSEIFTPPEEGTVIMKFNIDKTSVKFMVAGEVPGQILNQYSMDEYNSTFRIATTKWGQNGTTNNLYILNSELQLAGKIEGLASGETIKSVRFMGKTGYIVTFKNMDPLFVIDLSNPNAPKVVGELKIPGFSNYLHPVNANQLLGIGIDTVEIYSKDKDGKETVVGNRAGGLKVSLFDVSDPKNPKELDKLVFGAVGSWSEAQYNPRAFVWWNNKTTALFPVYINGTDGNIDYNNGGINREGAIMVSINDNKLVEKGRLLPDNINNTSYNNSRVLYIDNSVYISIRGVLITYDYNTLKEISRLSLN